MILLSLKYKEEVIIIVEQSVGHVMLVILLKMLIAIPLSSSNISTVQLAQTTSTLNFFSVMLSLNAYCVTAIGSWVSWLRGLIHVSKTICFIGLLMTNPLNYKSRGAYSLMIQVFLLNLRNLRLLLKE